MNKLPERKNIRLKNHDYSQSGYYFITICTKDKKNLFWNTEASEPTIKNVGEMCDSQSNQNILEIICKHGKKPIVGEVCDLPSNHPQLSNIGKTVDTEINKIHSIYEKEVEINKYVIMPNHIHMIIVLHGQNEREQITPTISRIIRHFKTSITKQIGFSIWQKSFYDHIIRDEKDYRNVFNYIETNPLKWKEDKYYY